MEEALASFRPSERVLDGLEEGRRGFGVVGLITDLTGWTVACSTDGDSETIVLLRLSRSCLAAESLAITACTGTFDRLESDLTPAEIEWKVERGRGGG